MITIAWDVDDVLNSLMHDWYTQAWLPAHPECHLLYDDLRCNPPHTLLGIDLGTYQASLDVFRLSPSASMLTPSAEVLAWFSQHGRRCRHLALTATPLRTAGCSAEWVFRHFGAWIRQFCVVPTPRHGEIVPVYDQTKSDFLQRFEHTDVLIDDNAEQVAAAQALGMVAFLAPRPWNAGTGTLSDVMEKLTALLPTERELVTNRLSRRNGLS